MKMQVRSLALLSGLGSGIAVSSGVGRSQIWLGSGIAVAVVQASSYSSYSTPNVGTFICRGCGSKDTHTKKG